MVEAQFVADVQKVLDRFFAETGWYPEHVKPVAGALLYTQYYAESPGTLGQRSLTSGAES